MCTSFSPQVLPAAVVTTLWVETQPASPARGVTSVPVPVPTRCYVLQGTMPTMAALPVPSVLPGTTVPRTACLSLSPVPQATTRQARVRPAVHSVHKVRLGRLSLCIVLGNNRSIGDKLRNWWKLDQDTWVWPLFSWSGAMDGGLIMTYLFDFQVINVQTRRWPRRLVLWGSTRMGGGWRPVNQ